MLTLNDGRSELWQWDTGRRVTVDADCSQVHFSNKVFGRSIDVDVVDGTAKIPDVLLQVDKELFVWAFVGTAENGYTKISKVFKVNKRNKPADYVFTPPEQTTLEEIKEKLDYLESIQDPDAIKNAVDEYLANNPIEVEETDPTVPAWAKADEKPKYTAQEVGALPSDTKIPNVDGFATEQYVNDKIAGIKIPDIPTTLPNPHALTFTGAVTGSYDGSAPMEIEIPEGGGEVPVATPNRLGGVKPVAKTEDMTEPVGVDENGGLWTVPGGGVPDSSNFETLIDFTTEETVSEFQVPIPHELDSVLKNASEHFLYLYIPRNTEDTATSTAGKVSISLTTSWKQVLFSDLTAIPAPTEYWTGGGCVLAFLRTYKTGVDNIDKRTVTQCDCASNIYGKNLSIKRIPGALPLQPFAHLHNTNYFIVEGTQEMYKGTRFVLGVRR